MVPHKPSANAGIIRWVRAPYLPNLLSAKIGAKPRIFNFLKNERYSTEVGTKGFLAVPHMLGYAAGFMHFLPLLKAHLKSVLGRKELKDETKKGEHAVFSP